MKFAGWATDGTQTTRNGGSAKQCPRVVTRVRRSVRGEKGPGKVKKATPLERTTPTTAPSNHKGAEGGGSVKGQGELEGGHAPSKRPPCHFTCKHVRSYAQACGGKAWAAQACTTSKPHRMPDTGQLGEGREHLTWSQGAHACPPLAGHPMWSMLGTRLRGDRNDDDRQTMATIPTNRQMLRSGQATNRTAAHNTKHETREPLNFHGRKALQHSLRYPGGRLTAMNTSHVGSQRPPRRTQSTPGTTRGGIW